jgi:hypothetical protein
MLKNRSRFQWAGAWCLAVIVAGMVSLAAGAAMTLGNGTLLLVACFVPPAVMLLVWRSAAQDATVAEILHAAETPSDGRR